MDKIRPEIRTFVLGAIALSTATWTVAFNLGAYHTIFYRSIFIVWVTVSTIFLISLLVPEQDVPIPWWGKVLMLVPTVLVVLIPLHTTSFGNQQLEGFLIAVSTIILIICLPYALYVAANVINADLLALPEARLRIYLVLIVLVVGVIGFWMGANNHFFLNCGDFKIAGDDQPANCQPGPPLQFDSNM